MSRRTCYPAALVLLLAATSGPAAEWSEEVPVRDGVGTVLRLRAKIEGDFLVVQALHEPGWHTYAMDNDLRAEERLAGKPSLGIEQGIRIDVASGGTLEGPWYQSEPRDLSKPDLRWYTWGFDETATFARRLERSEAGPVVMEVAGQACNAQTCRIIDVELTVPPPDGSEAEEFSTDGLVRVRTREGANPRGSASPQDSHR